MSKPDRPGELRGVKVDAISLVSKAANGERFKIFKSAEDEAPEPVKKDERGLFRILKEYFVGAEDASPQPPAPEIEKSGRKISGDRLGKLMSMKTLLNEVLDGLEDTDDTPKEAEELTKDDRQEAVNVEDAIQKALEPLIERIEKIENARGISNRVPEDRAVEKRGQDFWEGIF